MREQIIDGVRVLDPRTKEEMEEALGSGRPFFAPEHLAREFGLPEDEDPDIDPLHDPPDHRENLE